MQEETEYICPHCWQANTILVDIAAGSQTFIQDCEVCCNPIEFRCEVDDSGLVSLDANSIEQ